uniref:Predicted nuclease, contains PIN domain, potential toxin-antitoxin system component n=1 Tax=Candidatus Kentrum sp. FM TaxID=2126340 RepID=A0A450TMK3_9GAMM|nr:MAG: Predicted nuclease, contains PIN domain, potential toxin-antitoxin system component [Candidatus Kentron sp. FM]VFJ68989.1 MAG: Predicted nuclease, contains PIN domain, potential toxin-antitoxin system component [Candidatus Kentron sp. FM]VFK17708.1 MAG: Predicted nuclease, contains PIN domain, potential toxin-antitoxin system component [Candidatus Kentron sp. FM]
MPICHARAPGVLTEAGHFARHVRDLGLGSATDEVIDRRAQGEGSILVTRDLDFSDIRNYPPENAAGRLVLRVDDTSTAQEIAQLLKRFVTLPQLVSRIPGHLVVLDNDRVRFRPALPPDKP